uniref:CSON012638 protein n=1 Tax=Culicoides sonorensis TaxID=179676 RepID=A0A336M615_CULSO
MTNYSFERTKWKRQTAVGLELLAEAGNYAAFQRLYGNPAYLTGWPYGTPTGASGPSAVDIYYRQAAAAVALQKPLPYRLYPSMPGMVPGPSISHMSASNSLSSLSNFYQNSANPTSTSLDRRSESPVVNPGSPEIHHKKSSDERERSASPISVKNGEKCTSDDDESENIQV